MKVYGSKMFKFTNVKSLHADPIENAFHKGVTVI
jgi:hypothetical protein